MIRGSVGLKPNFLHIPYAETRRKRHDRLGGHSLLIMVKELDRDEDSGIRQKR